MCSKSMVKVNYVLISGLELSYFVVLVVVGRLFWVQTVAHK